MSKSLFFTILDQASTGNELLEIIDKFSDTLMSDDSDADSMSVEEAEPETVTAAWTMAKKLSTNFDPTTRTEKQLQDWLDQYEATDSWEDETLDSFAERIEHALMLGDHR